MWEKISERRLSAIGTTQYCLLLMYLNGNPYSFVHRIGSMVLKLRGLKIVIDLRCTYPILLANSVFKEVRTTGSSDLFPRKKCLAERIFGVNSLLSNKD